jgi:hypothetical protein
VGVVEAVGGDGFGDEPGAEIEPVLDGFGTVESVTDTIENLHSSLLALLRLDRNRRKTHLLGKIT